MEGLQTFLPVAYYQGRLRRTQVIRILTVLLFSVSGTLTHLCCRELANIWHEVSFNNTSIPNMLVLGKFGKHKVKV